MPGKVEDGSMVIEISSTKPKSQISSSTLRDKWSKDLKTSLDARNKYTRDLEMLTQIDLFMQNKNLEQLKKDKDIKKFETEEEQRSTLRRQNIAKLSRQEKWHNVENSSIIKQMDYISEEMKNEIFDNFGIKENSEDLEDLENIA